MTPLITGIINDAQQLVRQQLTLFQSEVKHDLIRTKDAAIPLGVGVAVSLLAGIFLFLMVAHLVVWVWPAVPLFAAYGIVGLVLGLVGTRLILVGKTKFDAFNPLPNKSVEGLKENIQWTTKM
ncbi:MAG TPA: phage holin family protein [Gemmataceae bacterium]|nr:phage holin family protein [Gemmataceae bacterium]